MAKEQDNFNQLSLRQAQDGQEPMPEQEVIAAQLLESQTRLALLMGRNMKCFTQVSYDDQSLRPDSVNLLFITYLVH